MTTNVGDDEMNEMSEMKDSASDTTFTYELRAGAIVVDNVNVVIDLPNVKILEIDLTSKYPGMVGYVSMGDMIGVLIYPNEDTLHRDIDHASEPTEILFKLNRREWVAISDAARYTWRIALYRRQVS